MIELLVVIAIIALLMAILVPSLSGTKHQARTVLCRSNQRQLSLVFSIYQQQTGVFPYGFNDKGFGLTMTPPPNGYAGDGSDRKGWWWFNCLAGLTQISLKPGSILWCPSRGAADSKIKTNILCENYGVNRSICMDAQGSSINHVFVGKALRAEEIRRPAGTMLFGDSGYSVLSWMAAVNTGGVPFENVSRIKSFYIPGLQLNQTRNELTTKPDALRGRHPHRMLNLVFADGHNELRPAEFLGIKRSSDYPSSLWAP